MITEPEHAALRAFARLSGRNWRRELAKHWENGTLLLSQVSVSEDELAALVRLKGKLGPSGLQKYKLPDGTGSEGRRSGTQGEGR